MGLFKGALLGKKGVVGIIIKKKKWIGIRYEWAVSENIYHIWEYFTGSSEEAKTKIS